MIFATSFGYFDPHVLVWRRNIPTSRSSIAADCGTRRPHPKNVGTYFGFIDECQYLYGIVAGHTTKSKKLGFVAGKPIPQVLRDINAFTLGARSVDPAITCTVVFTGDWSLPVKEAEAAISLIDQGVDVITCHVNSPKVVIENAENGAASTRAATTPISPSWRPKGTSPAPNGAGKRSTPITSRRSRRETRSRDWCAAD